MCYSRTGRRYARAEFIPIRGTQLSRDVSAGHHNNCSDWAFQWKSRQLLSDMNNHHEYMQMAIDEAREGISQGHGGPFGCVIVKDGKVLAKGHNRVLKNHDATAHGEITAIREAGQLLGTHDLSGCTLYTTGEPCHMCLCAILWANIDKVYYGCTIADNARIGFRDEHFDSIFGGRDKLGNLLTELDRDKCLLLFDEYNATIHKNY